MKNSGRCSFKPFLWLLILTAATLLSVSEDARAADPGTLKWAYTVENLAVGAPAIGPDGTIYFGAHNAVYGSGWGNLYALKADGALKWQSASLGGSPGDPAIGPDGTVYVTSYQGNGPWYLYAFTPNGTQKWRFDAPSSLSATAIGADGTIYVGSDHLYAFNPDGTQKWKFKTGYGTHFYSPVIGADGAIYVINMELDFYSQQEYHLCALNPNGTLKWKSLKFPNPISTNLTMGADGIIYVGEEEGYYLYAFKPDGTLNWMTQTPGLSSSPMIGADGTLYIALGSINDPPIQGPTCALNPDGTLKWLSWETQHWSYDPMAIGRDGSIYGGGQPENYYESYLSALNPDGALKWKYRTPGHPRSPAIGADGTIYVGCYLEPLGHLCAINSSSGGLAASAWPMLKHDVRHTGNAAGKSSAPVLNPVYLLLSD